jgi:aminoglycoside 2'-N-acetyltransferase I
VERVVRGAYDLGALGSGEPAAGFYPARGWLLWRGTSARPTPRGIERTSDDDGGRCGRPVSVELDVAAEGARD